MNLKTHTAYPEIQIDEDWSFTVRFYNGSGKIVFEETGQGEDHANARSMATDIKNANSDEFLKPEEDEDEEGGE